MALDPALLAALTSGATSGAKTSNTVGSSGIDWGAASKKDQPGAWSLGQGVIDLLSTFGYASAGTAKKVGENFSAIGRGDLGGLLDLLNPISATGAGIKGVQERRTYSQNLKDWGVDDNTSTWLGLALDIGLDPATYVSGGTIAGIKGVGAGVRLGTAANKAQSTVLKSAAEAAANNITDLARPFVPSEVPLTQGQKMGNYLTGVLRGYEFNKTAYAAERANRKVVSKLQKEIDKAVKAKDPKLDDLVVRNKEFVQGLESTAKVANASIADDLALIRREEFFRAVSQSPALQAKLGKRAEKLAKLSAKAEGLRFVDPKTAKKVDAEQASAAAKAGQLDEASKIETPSAVARQDAGVVTPPIREVAEAEARIANRIDAEELAKKMREKANMEKSYKRSLASVRTKYGDIANEALDFIGRINDPATGRRLTETLTDDDNPLEVLAELLRTNKVKPSPDRIARFANVLGVSADPQQSVLT